MTTADPTIAEMLSIEDGSNAVEPDIADMLALPAVIQGAPRSEEEIKRRVLEYLESGDTPANAYKMAGTNARQLKKFEASDAKFKGELAIAREINNEILENKLENIHSEHFNPAMAKVHSDNIKWILGVRDRARYGTKVEVQDHTSAQLVDVLRRAVDRIPRPRAINERPIEIADAQVIDHET